MWPFNNSEPENLKGVEDVGARRAAKTGETKKKSFTESEVADVIDTKIRGIWASMESYKETGVESVIKASELRIATLQEMRVKFLGEELEQFPTE